MIYADEDGKRIRAAPKLKAHCPGCKETLTPKCGTINIWHWSHKNNTNCDPWREGESLWHLEWKLLVKPLHTEVTMKQGDELHIADIFTGVHVIELQNSPISPQDIQKREKFYRGMVWVVNIQEAYEKKRFLFFPKSQCQSFRWKHPKQSLYAITKPLFLQITDNLLFEVKKMYTEERCAGWGYLLSKEQFINRYLKAVIQ